jgi:mannose-6-phosphate isomerase
MIPLECPVQPYAWGSRAFLASLRGRPVPSPEPEAELWLGAHPSAPSLAVVDSGTVPLGTLFGISPATMLGPAVTAEYGNRLPYLFKVLAADEPLSLQVHPDAAQAREGYERQRAGGFSALTYTDPYPKPELLVAVTDFDALCGFRHPEVTLEYLVRLGVAELTPVISALASSSDPATRLRAATQLLLGWPAAQRAELVSAVVDAGEPLALRLAKHHPGDVGVVLALLLNHVRLRPGEALFMPAGNVHSYLAGAGVEIMGASDNVLRAGITTKHIDAAELMRLVRYEVLADPVYPAVQVGPGLTVWSPPVTEFRLARGTASAGTAVTLPGDGPRIVVCLQGTAELSSGDSQTRLQPGEAVFVPAADPAVVLSGDAEVFQASPGV